MPEALSAAPCQIDHVIARKHGGKTVASNLALTCFHCNTYKGPNLSSLDPTTAKLTRLFNPRRHKWSHHFRWDGWRIVGRTAIGRATVLALVLNHPDALSIRQALAQEGFDIRS
jgi:hypothetical protein